MNIVALYPHCSCLGHIYLRTRSLILRVSLPLELHWITLSIISIYPCTQAHTVILTRHISSALSCPFSANYFLPETTGSWALYPICQFLFGHKNDCMYHADDGGHLKVWTVNMPMPSACAKCPYQMLMPNAYAKYLCQSNNAFTDS